MQVDKLTDILLIISRFDCYFFDFSLKDELNDIKVNNNYLYAE